MVKALFGLVRGLYPYIELILLAFLIGVSFRSSATGVLALLILYGLEFIWPGKVRAIAWTVAIFLYLQAFSVGTFFSQSIMALLIGGIRLAIAVLKK